MCLKTYFKHIVGYLIVYLLPSRLYCRYRNHTDSALRARGLYRRSGIAPCPEDVVLMLPRRTYRVKMWRLQSPLPGERVSAKPTGVGCHSGFPRILSTACLLWYDYSVGINSKVSSVAWGSIAGFWKPWMTPLAAVSVISPPIT